MSRRRAVGNKLRGLDRGTLPIGTRRGERLAAVTTLGGVPLVDVDIVVMLKGRSWPEEDEMGGAGPIVIVTDALDSGAQQVIANGLMHVNADASGIHDSRPLVVAVLDQATRNVLGGLTGRTSLGVLFIDLFFPPPNLRGSGLGSRILTLAEEVAKQRGCGAVVLYTLSFQAPRFYERHAYRVFGKIDCLPAGTSRLFMTKTLE